jgi:hypothetical protein
MAIAIWLFLVKPPLRSTERSEVILFVGVPLHFVSRVGLSACIFWLHQKDTASIPHRKFYLRISYFSSASWDVKSSPL